MMKMFRLSNLSEMRVFKISKGQQEMYLILKIHQQFSINLVDQTRNKSNLGIVYNPPMVIL